MTQTRSTPSRRMPASSLSANLQDVSQEHTLSPSLSIPSDLSSTAGSDPLSSSENELSLDSINSDLHKINQYLHKSKMFLANPNIIDHVEWVESGRRRKLVLKGTGDGD